ncbi:MAG TPA: endonuclease VII domain-containing protein [Kofleriaceae bacterium]
MKRIGEVALTSAERSARYRATHIDERRADDRERAYQKMLADPQAHADKHRRWRERDPEHARALVRKAGAKWRAGNKKKISELGKRDRDQNPGRVRAAVLRRNFGITPLQLAAAVYFQLGRCAICRRDLIFDKNLKVRVHVDHDHRSGAFRGVLCVGCNSAIGKLKDDPAVLMRAADYVRNEGKL